MATKPVIFALALFALFAVAQPAHAQTPWPTQEPTTLPICTPVVPPEPTSIIPTVSFSTPTPGTPAASTPTPGAVIPTTTPAPPVISNAWYSVSGSAQSTNDGSLPGNGYGAELSLSCPGNGDKIVGWIGHYYADYTPYSGEGYGVGNWVKTWAENGYIYDESFAVSPVGSPPTRSANVGRVTKDGSLGIVPPLPYALDFDMGGIAYPVLGVAVGAPNWPTGAPQLRGTVYTTLTNIYILCHGTQEIPAPAPTTPTPTPPAQGCYVPPPEVWIDPPIYIPGFCQTIITGGTIDFPDLSFLPTGWELPTTMDIPGVAFCFRYISINAVFLGVSAADLVTIAAFLLGAFLIIQEFRS